ncbi:MAG: ChuX/HutX family heme-like substrate-binding protein [Verrucomicrobiota bacterium JB024]|nr:ChuX/HutX family heme-like substrate-binding protein [Verrucomicrobiota bacterium JB024]
MSDPRDPSSRLPQTHATPAFSKCACGCQPEAVYVAELHREFDSLLPELSRLGELNCFARNPACILGSCLAMPDLWGGDGRFAGSTARADFHLDTRQWRHAYLVHEHHRTRGTFMGLEFFDRHHQALFRTFLSPDSEQRELQSLINHYYRRSVPLDEMSGWHRMGRLDPAQPSADSGVDAVFATTDPLSIPFDGEQPRRLEEYGFDGALPLVEIALSAAQEEAQELGVTVAGSFGRMSVAFTPHTVERLSPQWLYAGESGYALRLNLSAVALYWLGSCELDGQRFSYLEATNAHGELIVRLSSPHPDTHRTWQALAMSMES